MNAINIKKTRHYNILIYVILFLISNDLVFDFLFDFKSSDVVAFIFTLLSAVLVFVGRYKLKKEDFLEEANTKVEFIKSNFDNWQVLFSILDIVCGLISILTGLYFVGSVLIKVFKFARVPSRLLIVSNKIKNVGKGLVKTSLGWTAYRQIKKGDNNMFKWLKANKLSCLFGLLNGFLGFVASYYTAPVYIAGLASNMLILLSSGVALLALILTFVLGGENVLNFTLRAAQKNLPEDNKKELIANANKVAEQIKAIKTADAEKLAKQKKAQKILAEKKLAEAKAKEQAELDEIAKTL